MSSVSVAFQEAMNALQQARASYDAKDDKACLESLRYAKLQFLSFPTYFQPKAESRSRKEEVMVVREVYEYVCLSAARLGDVEAFSTAFAALQTYYTDFATADLPESSRQLLLTGLNLLCLLVQNKVWVFHAQLELIPAEQHSSMYVRPVVELERYLMEGSYTRLLRARETVPTNDYVTFLALLTETVATEIAMSMTQGYQSVSTSAAKKLLMIDDGSNASALGDYVSAYDWKEEGDKVHFRASSADGGVDPSRVTVNFHDLLQDQLGVAMELQRIV
eukprot:PhM_4_TR3138/c0_g1_i1/m.18142/K03031/PSMD8, RPN12; 26S proteasome regulatory subunit N12